MNLRGYLFDVETNWLEDRDAGADGVHTVHCGVSVEVEIRDLGVEGYDVRGGKIQEFVGAREIGQMAEQLAAAEFVSGHNISRFDVPVLQRLFRMPRPKGFIDTLSMSRMNYASNHEKRGWAFRNAAGRDEKLRESRLPVKLVRSHSLEAWGYKLGIRKHVKGFETKEAFERFTPELLERCSSDVDLNLRLLEYLLTHGADYEWAPCSLQSALTESEYAYINGKQVRNGVGFDEAGAAKLAALWTRRQEELTRQLREIFPPWWAPKGDPVTTKRDATRKKGRSFPETRVAGTEHQAVELVEFNPGSRAHVADRFTKLFGWKPRVFTPTGDPEVSEDVLDGLDFPAAPLVREYLFLGKRLGQLCEGKQSWVRASRGGVIRSDVFESGTRTSRMTHRNGLAQVPKVRKSKDGKILREGDGGWGFECRSLFRPTRNGWLQVGADASGLELRMLAHYMGRWDDGAFARTLLEGDPHTEWMALTGIEIRDDQKTFTYALLYGAGDEKLGQIILESWRRAFRAGLVNTAPPADPSEAAIKKLGRERRGRLLRGLPALDRLIDATKAAHSRGHIRLIDGCVIGTGSEHGALNDLLQGGGARVMKTAKTIFDRSYHEGEFEYMLDVHDEWQLEAPISRAHGFGMGMVVSIVASGEQLGLRIPLAGQYKVGLTWAETH